MPYYNEVFIEDGFSDCIIRPSSTFPPNVTSNNITSIKRVMGYRSGGPKASYVGEYYEHEVDPYNHFISGVMDRRRPKGYTGPIDRGHPFESSSRRMLGNRISGTTGTSGRMYRNCYPSISAPGFSVFPVFPSTVNGATLEQFAQASYSSSVPRQSAFDGAQFLGELREGLPSVPLLFLKDLRRKPANVINGIRNGSMGKDAVKSAGSEWVNLHFAIKPFLSDIWGLTDTLLNFDKKYREAIDNVSKPVHRARFAPKIDTVVEVPWGSRNVTLTNYDNLKTGAPVFPLGRLNITIPQTTNGTAYNQAASCYGLMSTSIERWFEGSFATFYSYPAMSAPFVEKAAVLLGFKPSLETFWELAPWSWLIDWLFSIQSTIAANTAAADEQVLMNYGYAMERIITRSMIVGYWAGAQPALNPLDVVYESTRKRRIRANPFGFQAKLPTGLNDQQWSILAALGANRIR